MKKLFFLLSSILFCFTLTAQEKFNVKDFALADKHKRAINLANSTVINTLSVVKKAGLSVEDYATQMGDNWAATWNKDAGFATLVNGQIWNMSSYLTTDNPKIEILDQKESMVKLKVYKNWKNTFSNGPVFGITEAEMSTFWNIASQRIAQYLGCNQEAEDNGDFIIYTITKK